VNLTGSGHGGAKGLGLVCRVVWSEEQAFLRPWERLLSIWHRIERFLGHGRALETFLTLVTFQFWVILVFSPWRPHIIALQDVPLSDWAISVPFLVSWAPSSVGLFLNAWGFEASRYFRIVGASAGMTVWFYILTKNCLVGYWFAGVNPWCTMGILSSAWIIHRGMLGLPRPGAPGEF
jgi:hypothetical protein